MIKIIIFSLLHILINKIFLRFNFLLDRKQISYHKKKIDNKTLTPLSGGIVFIIFISFFYYDYNLTLILFTLFIYLIGVMSDLDFLSSPLKRIILQSLTILVFILLGNISIESISIDWFDTFLEFRVFNIIFLCICILVIMNGFNFLDGVNTLVLGYMLINLLAIYHLSNNFSLNFNLELYKDLITILSVVFIFNFFGLSFLGDSGTYSLSFFIGVLFIVFAFENYEKISPYYVACLLWYPAIENLFSILRRYISKRELSKADNGHLHHLLYVFIKNLNITSNSLFQNTLTGMTINIYVFSSIIVASNYYLHTKVLLSVIFFNIFIYLSVYFLLNKLINKNKKKGI